MKGRDTPPELVARIKGAAHYLTHKTIAKLSGVSEGAIKHYTSGTSYPEVEPAEFPVEQLRAWMLEGTK